MQDEFVAYCLDRATTLWGTEIESSIREVANTAKTREASKRAVQRTLDKYLYADKPESAPGRFRDPVK